MAELFLVVTTPHRYPPHNKGCCLIPCYALLLRIDSYDLLLMYSFTR